MSSLIILTKHYQIYVTQKSFLGDATVGTCLIAQENILIASEIINSIFAEYIPTVNLPNSWNLQTVQVIYCLYITQQYASQSYNLLLMCTINRVLFAQILPQKLQRNFANHNCYSDPSVLLEVISSCLYSFSLLTVCMCSVTTK